jgi:hypothetical protein
MSTKRQPSGIPAGGEYASHTRPSGAVSLDAPPTLAGHPIPTIKLAGLTHVGQLDLSLKRSWSLEGQGLSVSQNPEAWEEIARLGGNPTWSLPMEKAIFLDYHALTAEQKTAISEFGVEAGYIEIVPGFEVTWWDDEDEMDRCAVFLTIEEALLETDGYQTEDGDDPQVTGTAQMIATATFPDPTVKEGETGVDQILATVWVSELAAERAGIWWADDLAGVWWDDDLDVDRLSAPRGVIVPSKIARWIAGATPYEEPTDDSDDEFENDFV